MLNEARKISYNASTMKYESVIPHATQQIYNNNIATKQILIHYYIPYSICLPATQVSYTTRTNTSTNNSERNKIKNIITTC